MLSNINQTSWVKMLIEGWNIILTGTYESMCMSADKYGFNWRDFFLRRKTIPLWLGGLWMEICPLRWTYPSLQETHRPPPFPVSEMWQSIFQVRSPSLTYEEALLIRSSGSFPYCRKIQYLQHRLSSTRGRSPAKALQGIMVKSSKEWK